MEFWRKNPGLFLHLVLILIPPERCELEVIDTQPFIYVHIAFFAKYLAFSCQELPSKFNAVFFSEPGRIPKDEAESRQSR